MHRTFKHLVTSLALLFFIQVPITYANGVEDLASVQDIHSAESSLQQSDIDIYGPTTKKETLWSIAKDYRMDKSVNIYKMVLAIYKLNSKAFEDHNIHGLISGSTLLMPNSAQVTAESVTQAKERMAQDAERPIPSKVDPNIIPPVPVKAEDYLPKNSQDETLNATEQSSATEAQITGANQGDDQLAEEDQKFTQSQLELLSQRLNAELGHLQSQLDQLQTQLTDEERVRHEAQAKDAESLGLIPTLRVLLNKYPSLWVAVILPLLFIVLLLRLIFNRQSRETTKPRLLKSEELIATSYVVLDSKQDTDVITPETETETETETRIIFDDSELPIYQEKEACEDAEREPQEFDTNIIQESPEPGIYSLDETLLIDNTQLDDNLTESTSVTVDELRLEPKESKIEASDVRNNKPTELSGIDDEPDLDVGLDEFSDVLGNVTMFDVDEDSEMNSKLDLAKAFIEMDDFPTAKKLLKAVMKSEDAALKAEAEKLFSRIKP